MIVINKFTLKKNSICQKRLYKVVTVTLQCIFMKKKLEADP
jgi:hypothetical protein